MLTVRLGYLDCFPRLFQVRPSDHEFHTSYVNRSLQHALKVILVCFLAVVYASEDWVTQIDANLVLLSCLLVFFEG